MTSLLTRRAVAFLLFAIIVGAAAGLFFVVAQPGGFEPMPIAPGS